MKPFEGAVECGLICESGLNGDVGKRQAGIRHEVSGFIDAAFNQPLVRRPAKGVPEGASKVAHREVTCLCNLMEGYLAIEVGFQQLCCSSLLHGRKSATKLRRWSLHAAIRADKVTGQGMQNMINDKLRSVLGLLKR